MKRSFNHWVNDTSQTFAQFKQDMAALSGVRDVSQDDLDDAAIQAAFADDPARKYAEAEMSEGRWREDHPNDPTET